MLHYVRGNLFESPAQAWVNTVNTEGVMGKGIALTYKRLFPDMFEEYKQLCSKKRLKVGVLHYYRIGPRLIVNFPTKTTWRLPSQVAYISAGLRAFVASYQEFGVSSAAFPPLGCGNGELDFEADVRPLLEFYLAPLPISVYVYPPQHVGTFAEHRTPKDMERWIEKESQVRSADAVWRDLVELSRSREFSSPDLHAPFRAEELIDADGERFLALRVGGGDPIYVSHDEVRMAWEDFRSQLVLTRDSFSAGSEIGGLLLAMLSEMPYMKSFVAARDIRRLDSSDSFSLRWNSEVPEELALPL